jgi:hypothetical protein
MYLIRPQIVIGLVILSLRPAASAELISNFDEKQLDTKVWNACQIDQPPLTFEELTDASGVKRRVLRNVVSPSTGNKDQCKEFLLTTDSGAAADGNAGLEVVVDEEPESIGPSLIAPSPLDALDVAECPKGSKEVQRNELRLQKRKDLTHDNTDPHWYSITFHADGEIPSCGSARWILAQWKQENDGPSPFLAERFDNGVLHVTVQNGDCRCVVAKAEGDIDAIIGFLEGGLSEPPPLAESKPIKCLRTDLADNAPEQSCEPTGMTVLTVGGAAPPPLPDPKREWVRMTYLVRNGFDGHGHIDVYAGKQFVVRVVGSIGYKTDDPGNVKFKFGHYRARTDATASVSVDRLCFSKDVKVCAPDLNIVH